MSNAYEEFRKGSMSIAELQRRADIERKERKADLDRREARLAEQKGGKR
ncbi:MAG: hypothetical protein ABW046_20740 [Actinoplanes sp.]